MNEALGPHSLFSQPSPNGPNGRDTAGRFTVGNRGGPGNPKAKQVGALRSALLRAVTEEDMQAIVGKPVALARSGSVPAAKEVLDRCLARFRRPISWSAWNSSRRSSTRGAPPREPARASRSHREEGPGDRPLLGPGPLSFLHVAAPDRAALRLREGGRRTRAAACPTCGHYVDESGRAVSGTASTIVLEGVRLQPSRGTPLGDSSFVVRDE